MNPSNYRVGQKSSDNVFEILAIENGKVCLADHSDARRYEATRRWYKLDSDILARKLAR